MTYYSNSFEAVEQEISRRRTTSMLLASAAIAVLVPWAPVALLATMVSAWCVYALLQIIKAIFSN